MPLVCWLRGHQWANLLLEDSRVALACARCGMRTAGWDVPDRITNRRSVVHLVLRVEDNRRLGDGTRRLTLVDAHLPESASLVFDDVFCDRWVIGDTYELALTPTGQPDVFDPRRI